MNTRPTPETDAARQDGYTFEAEDLRPAIDFARKLERERDEAREELGELKRDLSALLNSLPHGAHDATEGVGIIRTMREAIKEAHEALDAFKMPDWSDLTDIGGGTLFSPTLKVQNVKDARSALAKLQPFMP